MLDSAPLSTSESEQRCFKLEAGFRAQQKHAIDSYLIEAFVETQYKRNQVRITLKTGLHEKA
ncbi:hypothetical protein [Planococcus shenhongbingii]|uniref:Uncharacterized protein n=1 Tax=Planococcus shenhongbingii TaxID=3058398 RepID=A0ABT8NDF7_9BACL|nr:hypothetical protein [Planococcus sp. N017]MDN7245922.1 hypothetical protein [Planococcus sp. N017]